MAQIKVPEAPKEYATHYEMLLGVDFQADQTAVDRRRSPDMVNMISDFGGNPVKRDGYRAVGIGYSALVMVDGKMYGVYATSSVLSISILELDGYEFKTIGVPYSLVKNVGKINGVFVYQECIYIIAEECLVRFDTADQSVSNGFKYAGIGTNMMSVGATGETAPVIEDNIPITAFNMKPDSTDARSLEDKNIFSIYHMAMYHGDGSTKTFKIPNYQKMGSWYKAEVKDANGDWLEVSSTVSGASTETGKTLDGEGTETNNIVDASVTFTTAPASSPTEDNVRITYAPYSTEEVAAGVKKGYYNETLVKLLKSGTAAFQDSRLFIADTYKVYYSDVNNPFKVSDLAWFDVESEVVFFTKSSNHLAIVTRDNGGNTIFLADEATRVVDKDTGDTETYFTVKASNAGIGGIAPKCAATLSDEPMFLSSTGVYGLLTNWISEKYAVNRSSRINRKLCKEPNLETAVGIAYNDYFYLAINGRMYVLDGRHKESDRAGNKPLEAYYFEGLPAIENMFVIGEKMYFADDTKIYTWNDDLTELERYYDDAYMKEAILVQYQLSESNTEPPEGEWLDEEPEVPEGETLWYKASYDDLSEEIGILEVTVGDKKLTGEPVRARWCSVFDDDDAPQKLKTYMKKGSMITIVPHYKSGCEITLVKDGDVRQYLGSFDADLQTFERIDFRRFTFSANAVAFDKFTKKKIKKYKRLQIIVENNKAEPFGITQITKTYTFGNYAKR